MSVILSVWFLGEGGEAWDTLHNMGGEARSAQRTSTIDMCVERPLLPGSRVERVVRDFCRRDADLGSAASDVITTQQIWVVDSLHLEPNLAETSR